MMSNWNDASRHTALIDSVRKLRQAANANNFNYRLLGDITLVTAVAGYLAAAYCARPRHRRRHMGPRPRQDDDELWPNCTGNVQHINFAGLCQHWGISDARQAQARAAFAYEPDDSKPMWFDPLVRIPDFLAGAVAAWNIDENTVSRPKFRQVLQTSIADNSNIEILRLRVPSGGGLSLARIVTSIAHDGENALTSVDAPPEDAA